jgi:MarR family
VHFLSPGVLGTPEACAQKAYALFRLIELQVHGVEREILELLIWFGSEQSSREIAERAGLDRSGVQRGIDRLNQRGLIRTRPGRGTQSATHELLFLEASGGQNPPLAEESSRATGGQNPPLSGGQNPPLAPRLYKVTRARGTYLPTTKNNREKIVSKYADSGPVPEIVQTLKDCFQLAVLPGNPKLNELLALAVKLDVPPDSLPEYLRDLRRERPHYRFTFGGIVFAAHQGGLETWKLRRMRKPAASSFERAPLDSGPPMSEDEQVEFWLRILAKEPDHVQGNAEMARLRPRAMAAGAGG